MNRIDKTRVLVINAISTDKHNKPRLDYLSKFIASDTELAVTNLSSGYESLEYLTQELFNSALLIELVKQAEKDGYHGILLNCFYDPALDAAREAVSIPVVGAGEANLFLGSRLGHKFAVLATSKKEVAVIEQHISHYHLSHCCAGVFPIGIDVPTLQSKGITDAMTATLADQIKKATEAGAEVLLIACTAATGVIEVLSKLTDMPVLDPGVTAIKVTEMAASLYHTTGISHSKTGLYSYQDNATFH